MFGAGFGAVQNLTLLSSFTRAGESGTTAASAMWNASFDAGTATGALALGVLAAGIGLDWTYVVVAAGAGRAAARSPRPRPGPGRGRGDQPGVCCAAACSDRMKRISSPDFRSQVRRPSTSPRDRSRS